MVADDDAVLISIVGKRVDEDGDVGFDLHIANKTDRALSVFSGSGWRIGNAAVNDLVLTTTVDPGAETDVFAWFDRTDLRSGTITALGNVRGSIAVQDAETLERIGTYAVKV